MNKKKIKLAIGDTVFYYINRTMHPWKESLSYRKLTGKIVRIFQPEEFLTAVDIENMFGISPKNSKFKDFYGTSWGRKNELRAVMKTKEGDCYMLYERYWNNNTLGSEQYVERIPNSIAFIIGED